jgi:hypothetical protein
MLPSRPPQMVIEMLTRAASETLFTGFFFFLVSILSRSRIKTSALPKYIDNDLNLNLVDTGEVEDVATSTDDELNDGDKETDDVQQANSTNSETLAGRNRGINFYFDFEDNAGDCIVVVRRARWVGVWVEVAQS